MGGVTHVEVLDVRGRVVARHRVERWPLTIGRGYANDLIVDDPYVCPRHLRVVEHADGALEAEDLGSVNGSHCNGGRVARTAVKTDTRIRIGHTVLRFVDGGTAVAPTLAQRRDGSDLPALARRPLSIVCALGIPLWLVAYRYLVWYERPKPMTIIGYGVVAVTVLWAWSVAWALLNRLVARRWRLGAHAAIASFYFGIAYLIDLAEGYVSFLMSGTWSGTAMAFLLAAIPFACIIALHLQVIGTMPRARRWAVAAGASVAFITLTTFLGQWSRYEFSNSISFADELRPLPRAWIPGDPLDSLDADVTRLAEEVEKRARTRP
jgi:hypothetical protein